MNQLRRVMSKAPPEMNIQTLKRVFSLPAPVARLILDNFTKPLPVHKPWIHKVNMVEHKWSGCWIGQDVRDLDSQALQKRIDDCDILLFNVHGGGFRIGSCTMYMETYIQWIRALKKHFNMEAMIMSVDYRLAPEFKYPSPVEDIYHAYLYLTKIIQVDAGKIITIGDSPGAALILEMLFLTHDPSIFEIVTDDHANESPHILQLPRPAGSVLVSPITTDESDSESWIANEKYDFITRHTAKVIRRDYFEPADKTAEKNKVLGIAKMQTGFRAFLPEHVLMFIGRKEVLLTDALDLAMRAENDGVHWETIVEDCVHDWFCVREVVKDKKILEQADVAFSEFCYRSVNKCHGMSGIKPILSSSTKVLYENGSNSMNSMNSINTSTSGSGSVNSSTIMRTLDGLERVMEEDEEESIHKSHRNAYVAVPNLKTSTFSSLRYTVEEDGFDDSSSVESDGDDNRRMPSNDAKPVLSNSLRLDSLSHLSKAPDTSTLTTEEKPKQKPKTVFV